MAAADGVVTKHTQAILLLGHCYLGDFFTLGPLSLHYKS